MGNCLSFVRSVKFTVSVVLWRLQEVRLVGNVGKSGSGRYLLANPMSFLLISDRVG
jgi:hypothetical protein